MAVGSFVVDVGSGTTLKINAQLSSDAVAHSAAPDDPERQTVLIDLQPDFSDKVLRPALGFESLSAVKFAFESGTPRDAFLVDPWRSAKVSFDEAFEVDEDFSCEGVAIGDSDRHVCVYSIDAMQMQKMRLAMLLASVLVFRRASFSALSRSTASTFFLATMLDPTLSPSFSFTARSVCK